MRRAVLAGAFMLAVAAKPAHGEAIDGAAIGYAVDAATPYFQLRQFEAGWSGLQDEVTACYRALRGWKMQSKAALCPASIPCSQKDSRSPCETLASGRLAP